MANYMLRKNHYLKRDPSMVKASVLIIFMVGVLMGGIGLFVIFDSIESLFR